MTKFIGFAGHKQVGKDLSAKIVTTIFEHNGLDVATTSFATVLKNMCVNILGLKKEGVFGTDAEKNAPSHIKWDNMPEEIRLKYTILKKQDTAMLDKFWPVPRTGQMTNREVLQIMGTDIFRKLYPNVWTDSLFRQDWSNYEYVLVPDVRFPNEALAIEQNDGILIRIERETGLQDTHISETALDGYDFKNIIVNNGSLHELEEKLKVIIL